MPIIVGQNINTIEFLSADGNTYEVTVDLRGVTNIPEGAELVVKDVAQSEYDNYLNKVAKVLKTDADAFTYAKLLDISIVYGDQEIQPNGKVGVEIQLKDGEDISNPQVVHFGQETEVLDAAKTGNGVAFATTGFSVYAVVEEGQGGENARMALNFYHGEDLITTVYVKNGDDEDADLEKIIYDPGVGTMNHGELFKGWILDNADYTVDDVAEKKDIEEIRAWAKEKTNADSITEGDTYNFYAMIFKTFSVTYKDEVGTTIKSEALIFSGDSKDYTINQPYTPKEQDAAFQGWYWINADMSVTDPLVAKDGSEAPFANGTEVTIKDNITFTVNVPRGYWLSFDENGDGASYTPPQFVANTSTTEKPADPARAGYNFTGWNTAADGSGETWLTVTYNSAGTPSYSNNKFGSALTARTTLYAQWTPKPAANYTVIVWTQRVSDDKNAADADKTYDVEEVITLSGPVGSVINTITQPNSNTNVNTGRGNSVRNYSVNGSQKSYTGFHAARYDTGITIEAEGTSVVNVYYDRNLITINFDAGNGRYIRNEVDGGYSRRVTYTGLFDAPLTFAWPSNNWANASGTGTTYSNLWTHDQANGGATLTFYGSFKLYVPTNVTETLTRANAGNTSVRFIRQKPDGSWPANTNETDYVLTIGTQGGTFTFSEKYAGFSVSQYRTSAYTTSDTGWTSVRNNNGSFRSVSNYSQLNIRFTRDKYPITYFDGTYFNGDGVVLKEATKAPLGESEEIYYEASVASYNADGADYYTPVAPVGYTFGGWYVDPTCNRQYTFTTMPAGGIIVYAKWVQTQYRVFLHPNVPTSDTSFSMGGQSTSFRVDYNEKIAGGNQIHGTRDDYDLIGWYTDEACTQPFNFDAFTLNDTTVTTPYDKTQSTETDLYGNPTEETNKDATNNRFWITRKLDLYAKWRSRLEGANGIDVVYDAGEGTNAPEDPLTYLDNTDATAGAASTPTDTKKQFLHWVVQKWNGTEYVDTEQIVYPGDLYTVLKANAKPLVTEWVNPNDENDVITITDPTPGTTAPDSTHTKIKTATYTVQLRAEYGDKDAPTPTHIDWYKNYGEEGATRQSPIYSEEDLQINQAVPICAVPTREGYTFLGWARVPVEVSDSSGDPVTAKILDNDTVADYMYLTYHAAEGTTAAYYTVNDGTDRKTTQVAADEETPYHDMYAVWQKVYKVTVKKVVNGTEADKSIEFEFTPTKNSNGTITTGDGYKFKLKDNEEHVAFEDLLKGDHFSVAEKAESGFEISVTGKYTDDEDVEHEITGLSNGSDITIQGDTEITVTNTRQSKKVKIYKVDDSATPVALSGVGFTLNDNTLTTNADGYTDIVTLYVSDTPYDLNETTPAEHYDGLSAAVPVTVSEEAVTVPAGTTNVSVSETPDSDGVYTITVVNPRKLYNLTIEKKWMDGFYDNDYVVTVKYGTGENDKVSLTKANDWKAVVALPYGTAVTVLEEAITLGADNYLANYTTTYYWNDERKDSISETLASDSTVRVENKSTIAETGLVLDTTAARAALLSLFAFAMMCVLGFSLKRRYVSRR